MKELQQTIGHGEKRSPSFTKIHPYKIDINEFH